MEAQRTDSLKAFTLIEVILTISLIALISTAFVINLDSLLRNTAIESLENEYWRAVDEARTGAVFKRTPHYLEWSVEEQSFKVVSPGGAKAFAVDTSDFGDVEVEVLFEEVAPENSYVLIGGELVATREIVDVGFFPDGTCTPYSVTLKVADFESRFQMDPWTGVRLVDPNNES